MASNGTPRARVSLRRESSDSRLNRDVLAVCSDVVEQAGRIVARDPPLGRKPFVVQQSADGHPRACLNGLPDEYLASVTCLHNRYYAQLAFQLGHELGHFYVDPHRSNWLIESVCTALSYCCLTALSEKWTSSPPYPNWSSYASSFCRYREQHVSNAVRQVGLRGNDEIPVWIRDVLPAVVANNAFSRCHEALCAEVISSFMWAHSEACSALTRLGEASQTGKPDFTLWRAALSRSEISLVDALSRRSRPVKWCIEIA